MVPGIEHKRLISFDGTEIAYQVRGDGPAIVLANGLGGRYLAFRYVYAELGLRHRTLCWDYRGLFDSGPPGDPNAIEVHHQCEDQKQLMDAEGIDRAILVGWSMGVQVNFEFYRRWPERVAGLVAINGTYGRPFRTALSSRVARYVIPAMLGAIGRNAALIGPATRRVVAWDGLIATMIRLGLVSREVDQAMFRTVAAGFAEMDWKLFADTLARLGQHDARDVLARVDVPLLVITGDRDILTPPFTAETIQREVPDAELVIVEGGTHYSPVEYPDVIRDSLRGFLSRVSGYGRATTRGRE